MARIALVGSTRSGFGAAVKSLENHQLVMRFASAQQALVELQAEQFDLLLVMLELPDIHGMALTDMLRAEGRLASSTPVLACSGLNSAINIRRAMRFGASGFLFIKDYPSLLEPVIDAVLQGGNIFPEHARLHSEEDIRLHHALNLSTQHVAVLHGLQCGWSPALLANLLRIPIERVNHCKRQVQRKLNASSLHNLIEVSQDIGLI